MALSPISMVKPRFAIGQTYSKRLTLITLKKTKTDFPYIKIGKSADANDFVCNFYSDDIEIYESFSSFYSIESKQIILQVLFSPVKQIK